MRGWCEAWVLAVLGVLVGCSPLAGPFAGVNDGASDAGEATACVYLAPLSSACSAGGATVYAWACADAPCSSLSFAAGCGGASPVTEVASYAGSCADWQAAGEPAGAATAPSGSSSGSGAGSSSGTVVSGGSCTPPATVAFAATWHPPLATAGACTASQIQGVVAACTTPASCEAFLGENGACAQCLVSASASTAWGPLVSWGPGFLDENVAGCVAQVDPTQIACAEAIQAFDECVHAACDASCGAASSGFDAAYQGCETLASQGACASAYGAATSCEPGLSSASAACLDPSSGLAAALAAFCG